MLDPPRAGLFFGLVCLQYGRCAACVSGFQLSTSRVEDQRQPLGLRNTKALT
jgi:hypothetical protein